METIGKIRLALSKGMGIREASRKGLLFRGVIYRNSPPPPECFCTFTFPCLRYAKVSGNFMIPSISKISIISARLRRNEHQKRTSRCTSTGPAFCRVSLDVYPVKISGNIVDTTGQMCLKRLIDIKSNILSGKISCNISTMRMTTSGACSPGFRMTVLDSSGQQLPALMRRNPAPGLAEIRLSSG